MPDQLVTVFRSADDSAEEDALAIGELLAGQGMNPVVLDDNAPDVPEGAWEVQVAPEFAAGAEGLIARASLPEDELVDVDESSDLDMETVFSAPAGTTQQMEAVGIVSLLESVGIATVMVGDAVLPNLDFEVRVAREHADRAREVIAEAQVGGPAAAEEAERATEAPQA